MATGPINKDGKVRWADVTDSDPIGAFLGMLGTGDPNQMIRDIQPLEMPSVSFGSRAEFDAAQKAAEKRWISKYGSLNNSNDGGKPGSIGPQNDPIGGGYTASYNPGSPGIDYRYSATSGGPVAATTSGEIRGNSIAQMMGGGGDYRGDAIRRRMLRGKTQGSRVPKAGY